MMTIKPIFYIWSEAEGEDGKFIVIVPKNWDYMYYDASWMNIQGVKINSLRADIDTIEKAYTFDTEQEALRKVASLYARQILDEVEK